MHLHFAARRAPVAEVLKPENTEVQGKLFSHLSYLQPFKTHKQSVSTATCQKNTYTDDATFNRNHCKHHFYHSI